MTGRHLTDQQVEAYRRRKLDATDGSVLGSHLAKCEQCVARVVDAGDPGFALASLNEAFLSKPGERAFHLTTEDLKRYAVGEMDEADRTIYQSHIEDCAQCSRAAEEISVPSSVVASVGALERTALATPNFWQRIAASFQGPSGFRLLYLGGAAVVMVSIVLFVFVVRSRYGDVRESSEVASNTTRDRNINDSTSPNTQDGTGANGANDVNASQNNGSGNNVNQTPANSGGPSSEDIVVRLVDGDGEITLDKQGKLAGLDGMNASVQRAVKQTLSTSDIEKPAVLTRLDQQGITFLGPPTPSTPFALLSPLNAVKLEDRPTFSWLPLAGATSYTVSVFDANFNRVAKSQSQSATTWTVPTSLKRGLTYYWEVTAVRNGEEVTSPVAPSPRAQFVIVDGRTAEEIRKIKSTPPKSHLVLGILYLRAGLLNEAEVEFKSLVQTNPNSPLAASLLGRVRGWKNRRGGRE